MNEAPPKPECSWAEVVARCPVCDREYISVPVDGGTCLWCRVKLKPVKSAEGKP